MFGVDDIHHKKFKVYLPEHANDNIHPYFKEPRKYRPPMINGMPATVEEYMEVDPEYSPEEEFIPDPIYDPMENNLTISFASTATIFRMYEDGINIIFTKPADMLTMRDIIRNYIRLTSSYVDYSSGLKQQLEHLDRFEEILVNKYDEYSRRRNEYIHGGKLPQRTLDLHEALSLFKG